MEEALKKIYRYKKNRTMGVIENDAIMYINCHGHILNVNVPYASVEHHGSLRMALEMLDEDDFVQVNKSDLINIRYVTIADMSSVTMSDGKKIPVTPAYLGEFQRKMLNMYIKLDRYRGNV